MQDSITHEALEALNQKATQGVWEVETDPYGAPFPGIVYPGSPFEFADFSVGESGDENQANAELCIALVNAYRTGQLILAQPSGDEVEAVARAIYKADTHDQNRSTRPQLDLSGVDLDQWYDENAAMPLSGPGFVRRHHALATAAITALDAHRGKQACLKARENGDG